MVIIGLWINKVGVEIECGIYENLTKEEKSIEGFRIERDGSLQSEDPNTALREYVSNPVRYPDNIPHLEERIERLYDNICEVNASMGLHIHVSMNKDRDYYRLTSLKFHDWFTNRVKQSDLWDKCPRLRKRVANMREHPYGSGSYGRYCQPINSHSIIDYQLRRGREKYRRINFMKDKYNTVEFRLFPAMETADRVKDAIDIVTTSINAYLRKGLYREKISTELNLQNTTSELTDESSIQGEVTYNV